MSMFSYHDRDGHLCRRRVFADIYFVVVMACAFLPAIFVRGRMGHDFDWFEPFDVVAVAIWMFAPYASPILFMMIRGPVSERAVRSSISIVLCAIWFYVCLPNV